MNDFAGETEEDNHKIEEEQEPLHLLQTLENHQHHRPKFFKNSKEVKYFDEAQTEYDISQDCDIGIFSVTDIIILIAQINVSKTTEELRKLN